MNPALIPFRYFVFIALSFLLASEAAAWKPLDEDSKKKTSKPVATAPAPGTTPKQATETSTQKSELPRQNNDAPIQKKEEIKQISASQARQEILTKASNLTKSGRAAEAYTLLHPLQSDRAGDPDYDYLLGIAALDSGKPNEAIFALERALAVNPSHLQARAEIARAYLAAGEVSEAKQEFETVQQQNPPREVSATIQKYLDIIETNRSGQKTTLHGYVEATLGNDSNVNSSTSNRQIAVPLFGGTLMNLSASGIATSDTFGSLGTGFNIRHELSPSWSILGGANVNKRNNSTQITFNTANGDANIGLNFKNNNDNYMAVVQAQSFVLANVTYRNASGLTTQWQRDLNNGSQISSYVQYSSLTYPDAKYRNADRYVLGAAYGTPLGADATTVIFVGLYGGAEQPVASGYTYLANSFYGGRMGGEIKLNAQFTLIASASMESRMHDAADTLFLVKRNDTQADLKLGMNYMPAQQWTISPSISYTNNESNIVINKYDRTVFSVSARRDFN